MRRAISRFIANADGATAIEYSVIVAGIVLCVLMAVLSFANELHAIYASIEAGVASLSHL